LKARSAEGSLPSASGKRSSTGSRPTQSIEPVRRQLSRNCCIVPRLSCERSIMRTAARRRTGAILTRRLYWSRRGEPNATSATATQLPVTVSDILKARQVVGRYLPPTPTLKPAALSEELGFDITLKCENFQPIGAFKVRGGVNLISQLSDEERSRGVVSASTGNHAQSIAYAARLFGTRAVIFMPENPNPMKAAAVRRLGGEIVEHGPDFDASNEAAREYAEREGMRYIHPANEPLLVAGVGTYALELIEAAPDLDT